MYCKLNNHVNLFDWGVIVNKTPVLISGPVHTTPEDFKHAPITGQSGFVFEPGKLGQEYHMISVFENCFPHT